MKSVMKLLARGLGWSLMIAGAFSFWIGGRAIHEFYKVDRIVAEVYGLIASLVLGLAGLGLRYLGERP